MLNISCTYYHLNVFLKVFIRLKTDPVFLTSLRDNIELLFFAKLLSLSSQSYRLYIFLWWYCSQTWSISGSSSWMNRDQVFLNLSSREPPPWHHMAADDNFTVLHRHRNRSWRDWAVQSPSVTAMPSSICSISLHFMARANPLAPFPGLHNNKINTHTHMYYVKPQLCVLASVHLFFIERRISIGRSYSSGTLPADARDHLWRRAC